MDSIVHHLQVVHHLPILLLLHPLLVFHLLQGAQVVILCDRLDPTLVLGQSEGIRFLPCAEEEARWISALDELAGIHGC